MKKLREKDIVLSVVKKERTDGVVHVCALCGSELVIVFNDADESKNKRGRGIFCPKDLKHINVRIMKKRKNLSF